MHGPFFIWLHSPELLSRGQKLGLYARFQSTLPQRLSELCILIIAAHWRAAGEWVDHVPIARDLGVDTQALEALRKGLPAHFKNADEIAAYELAQELLNKRDVSDAAYARVKAVLGERGILDLVAVLGYYSLIAMSMKTFALKPEGFPTRSRNRADCRWRLRGWGRLPWRGSDRHDVAGCRGRFFRGPYRAILA
jgi:4-carboxymuconolactone decarboxylase